VLSATPHTEASTEYASDVGVSSSELDPDGLRRYVNENDAMIDSNERAAA
jgi:hypothetical protein